MNTKPLMRGLIYATLLLAALFFLAPPLYMLITSLKTNSEMANQALNPWLVRDPTLEHYGAILTNPLFIRFFFNSCLVTLLVVAVSMLISVPAAFALSRMRFWGSQVLATGVFLTYLVPDTLLFFRGRLGRADIQPTINRHRIQTEDLRPDLLCDWDCDRRLPARRGASQEPALFQKLRIETHVRSAGQSVNNLRERTCKPGYVECDHFSRTAVACRLQQPTRKS